MSGNWKLAGVEVLAAGEKDKKLLESIDLTFNDGKITLLLGSNGSGKSTLLETMAGLRPLSNGRIVQGDRALWRSSKGRRARLDRSVIMETGISLQQSESQWFAATVRDEFYYSLKPYKLERSIRDRRITEAMEAVGLPEELLARDPWTLSGGQQRRLSLGCLLACQPQWLLLDEPSAGLDADGIRRLCAVLAAHRKAGRGAIVATHDLDALLPLADEVVVLSGGSVREAAPAAAWALAHAQDAAAPQAQRALAELRAAGYALPAPAHSGGAGAPWPPPQALAAALAAAAQQQLPAGSRTAGPAAPQAALAPPTPPAREQTIAPPANRLATRFDPRALIIAYLLLASAVLLQGSWAGLAAAAAITASALFPLRAQIRPWIKAIRAYILILAVISFIAGLQLMPLMFEWDKAMSTVFRFSGLMLAMLLGLPLISLMTPLRVQRALEQTFGWLSRFGIPVASFALTVTLIFRFIPLLAGEWERFAKIAHARGKASTATGSLPLTMIMSAVIPYVRSMLRLAEHMADALELRGIGQAGVKPTRGFTLRFTGVDGLIVLTAGLAGALLFYLATF